MTRLKHTDIIKLAAVLIAVLMAHSGAFSESASMRYTVSSIGFPVFLNLFLSETQMHAENVLRIKCPENISTNTDINKCSAEISNKLSVEFVEGKLSTLTWKMEGATQAISPGKGIHNIVSYNFNEGVTIVYYTATDNLGNSFTCSFSVVVTDKQLPEISVPENISIGCNDRIPSPYTTLQAFLNAGGNASDNCNLNATTFKLESEQKSNSTCPYTITRTYQIADLQGNIGQAKQQILVEKRPDPALKEEEKGVLSLKSAMANTITSTSTGGNWSNGTSWVGGTVPLPDDEVVIANGATISLTGNQICNDITINGTLNCAGNTLQVNGSWINDGTFNAGTGTVEFVGNSNVSISGASTNTFSNFVLNKGVSILTEVAISSNTLINDLTLTNGVLRINSGSTGIADITNINNKIPSTCGFIVDGGTLNTANFSIDNEGLILVASGTANFGTNSGNSVHTQIDGVFRITGGAVNIAGRLENTASGSLSGYTSGINISDGTVTVATEGNGLSNTGSINVTTNGTFNFTGGTIIFQSPSTASTELDLGLVGTSNKNVTGGTFQFGNASSPASSAFNISSQIPLYNLTTGNNADIVLLDDLEVTNQFTLNGSSNILLNDNSIEIPISGTGTYTIPLASSGGTSIPVIVNFTGGSFSAGASLTIESFENIHPDNANTNDYLERYWTINLSGISNPVYNVTANYLTSDISGDEAKIAMGIWTNSSTWIKGNAANTSSNTISRNGLNTSSIEITGIRNEPPVVNLTSLNTTICIGTSTTLNSNASGDPVLTYSWISSPAGFISSSANVTVSPVVNTSYTVTVTDGNGFTSTDNTSITVNLIPTVNIPDDQIVCRGASTTAVNFTGTGTSYTWTNSNSAIGLASSGTGNISSFTATNVSTSPITGTITVAPVYSNGGVDCTGPTQTFTITVNPIPTVNKPSDQIVCRATSTTAVNFSGTGTSYTWTNSNTAIGLAANGTGNISSFTATNVTTSPISGTVTVTPVYSNGGVDCTGSIQTFTITVNPTPTVNDPVDQSVCTGSLTTAVNFTGTGTSYIWTNSNSAIGLAASGTGNISSFTATNLTANPISGTITITPVYSNGGLDCNGPTQTFTITVTPPISASATITDPILCFGGTANILISASGGTPPYTYNFQGKPSNSTGIFTSISGSVAGTNYTWSVTDANGCTAFDGSTIVTEPAELLASASASTITCNGLTSTVTISANGGIAPYSYTFKGITNTTGIFTNVVAGNNIPWSVKDANNCGPVSGNLTIDQPTPISITSATVTTPIYCFGGTGTITIVATGGTGTLSYTFNGQTNTTGVFNNVYAGTGLSYSVTDANNCGPEFGTPLNVTQPAAITASAVVTTAITCNGGTATVTITASGGTGALSYTFNGETNTTGIFTGVAAGNNKPWSITDANTCTPLTGTINVTQPTALTASVSETTSIACFGQTANIKITASGGTGTKTYTFNGDSNTTGTFNGIGAQNGIAWRVEDTNGCFVTGTYDIVQPSQIVINSIGSNSAICQGSTLSLTSAATGGTGTLPYNWTGPGGFTANNAQNPTIPNSTPAASGTYNLTVTDANNCIVTATTDVTVHATPTMNPIGNQTVCHNSSTSAINFTGATSYTWTNNNTSIGLGASGTSTSIATFTATNTTNAPETATITVTPSGNGCTGTPQTFTITVNPLPEVTATNNTPVLCDDGVTNIVLSSNVHGTTFSWTANRTSGSTSGFNSGTGTSITQTLSNAGTVDYIITPTANGCDGTTTTVSIEVISSNYDLDVNVTGSHPAVVCSGYAFNLGFTGNSDSGSSGNWYQTQWEWVTRFTWTNNNTLIGLGASDGPLNDPGSITFTTQNTTNVDQTATITITPWSYYRSRSRWRWESWPSWPAWQQLCSGNAYSTIITVSPFAITCPTDITANTDVNQCYASITQPAPALSCGSGATLTWATTGATSVSGNGGLNNVQFQKGETIVTYTATNGGLTRTCSFTVTVTDNQPPVISNCPPPTTTLPMDLGQCGAAFTFNPTATDNCSPFTFDRTDGTGLNSGDIFPVGTTTISYLATDEAGNTAPCSFDVTVQADNQAPVITVCPGSQLECAPAAGSYINTNNWDITAIENCTGTVTKTYALTGATTGSGTSLNNVQFNVGTTAVTWTAKDISNNSSSCSFDVVVTEEPAITTDPVNQSACLNGSVTFTSAASGIPAPTYQWRKDGVNISGETGSELTIATVLATDAANYDVVVTNSCGSATSAPANLVVSTSPVITAQPANQTDCFGGSVEFTVSATDGETPYSYEWEMRSTSAGAWTSTGGNSSTLLVSNIGTGNNINNAEYRVTVIDACNNPVQSAVATLTVNQMDAKAVLNETVCQDGATTFTVATLGSTPIAYEWQLDGVTITDGGSYSGTTSQTLTIINAQVAANGRYSARATFNITQPNNNGVGATTCAGPFIDIADLIVDEGPDIIATPGDQDACSGSVINVVLSNGNGTPGTTYSWTRDNTTILTGIPASGNSATISGTINNAVPLSTQTTTFTITATANGCESTKQFTITVFDDVDPTVTTCPNDISVGSDADKCGAVVNYTLPTFDDNCDGTGLNGIMVDGLASGAEFPVGTTTVTYEFTDAAGNGPATCTFDVTVAENVKPVMACQNATVTLDATGNANITTADIDNGSSDNCGIASLTLDITSFGCADLGANSVILTATDNYGNSESCTATVTVEDNILPTAVCKDATVQLDAAGNATITSADIDDNSTDNCGIASMTVAPNTFNCTNVGTNAVVLTVTDDAGNISTCNATVTVEDNIAPNAICQNITEQLDATGKATITAGDIDNGSTDNCGIASMAISQTDFDCAGVGANTVTLTVSDVNGNSATCTATVTIEDTEAPVAECKDITVELDASGAATITTSDIDNGSTDNCGTPTLSLSKNSFDCTNVGANTVTLTVTDGYSNSATCASTVTVEDNINPTAVCKDATVQLDATGNVTIISADIDNGSSDNCGIASITVLPNSFDCTNVGSNPVVLTVTDDNGNISTCNATVLVEDKLAPNVVCQNITVQLDASGNAVITANDIDNGSTDNCGIASMTVSQTTFNCLNAGTNNVTLTVTDVNGNSSTCTATVTIEDTVDPIAVCKDVTVQLDAAGTATITTADIDNGSSDNCGTPTLTLDKTTFDCTEIGTNTVTLTATDAAGNTHTCTATVTISDTNNPIAITANISQNTITCYGDLTTVTINKTSGGVGTLTYSFNGVDNGTGVFTNVPAGTAYNWSITNPLGCGDISGTFDVVQPDILSADIAITDVTCSNNDATITISNPLGGSGSYEFTIDGGLNWQTDMLFTALVPDTYNVQMRDVNASACIIVLNDNVVVYKLSADYSFTHVTCFNEADGTITISNAHGGSNVYQYSINGGSSWENTATYTGVAPGIYDVRIRDANEHTCEFSLEAALEITQPTILSADVASTNITCNGDNDGVITVSNPAGGYGTYEFTINGGTNWQASGNFSSLTPNTYDVRIRDAAQTACEIALDNALVISEPPVPTVGDPADQVVCNTDNTDAVTFTGTVPGTVFRWTNNTPSIGLAANGSGNIASFAATNSSNATITATITVTPEIVNLGTTCYGTPETFTITVDPIPDVIATPGSHDICDGDNTNIALTSNFIGTSFSWTVVESGVSGAADGSGTTINQTLNVTSSAPGTATYTITPKIGNCLGTAITVVVTVHPLPTAEISGNTTICVGSSANLSVVLTGEQPWSITYTDGTTPVTVSGITSSPYTLTVNPAVTTSYQLTAVSDKNCTGTSFIGNVTVQVDQLPEASAGGTQTICVNTTATVSGASAANGTILWTHDGAGSLSGATTLTPTYTPAAGDEGNTITLLLTVTSDNACNISAPATATYTVIVDPLPTAVAGGSETICFDGTAAVTGASSTNGTVLWTHDGAGTLTGATTLTPTYTAAISDGGKTVVLTMTVTSNNGCAPQTATAVYTVNVNPEPQVNQPGDQDICTGSSTTMINFTTTNVIGTTTYTWTNSEPSIGLAASGTGSIIPFTGVNTGTEQVFATIEVTPHLTSGGKTCDGPSKTFTITVNPVPVAVAPIGLTYCNGELTSPFVLTGTPSGVLFDITGGAAIGLADISGVSEIPAFTATAGTATLTIVPKAYGCTGLPVSFKVTVRPTPTATISGGATVCQNSAIPSLSISNPMNLTVVVTYNINGTDIKNVNVPANSFVGIGVPTNVPGVFNYNLESVQYLNSSPPTCVTPITGTATVNVIAQPIPVISGPTNICAETTGNVYTTEAGMSNYAWVISAGGTITAGGTSSDNSVTVTWNSGGSHNVSVSYANSNNCASPTPTIFPVNVYPLPIPTITGSTSACVGTINKVYSTQPGMTDYQWTVSAGATITAGGTPTSNSVTVTWNSVGPQTITVNYKNTNGCVAVSPTIKNITVNPLPVATITGPDLLCAGTTGNVYTTEPGMTGYVWTVSSGGTITSGGTSTSNTATISWNTGGPQTVSVSYTNGVGCNPASPAVYPVAVNPKPVPTITGSTSVCVGSTGNIYTTEAGMTNYVWTVAAGGTITAGGGTGDNSVTISWNTTGAKTVTVNYTNASNCVATNATVSNVTVHPLPTPAIAGYSSVCVGSTSNVYSTVSGMSNYEWTVSGGGTITSGGSTSDNSVTVTWNTAGPQTVTLNYTNLNGCEATVATIYPVTVHPLPVPALTGPVDGCTGIAGAVYTTDPGMTGYSWTVSSGGSIISGGSGTDNTITIVWNTSGSKTVSVNYYNANSCNAASPTVLNVNVVAPSPPNCPGDQVVCSDLPTFNLTGATPAGGVYSGSGVTFSGGNYRFNPAAAGVGTHTINYTMPNVCADNCSFTIVVNEAPIGSASNATICSGESANIALSSTVAGTTFTWTASNNASVAGEGSGTGDVITDTLINNNIYYPGGSAGSQTVTYTVTASSNGCDYTFAVNVTVRAQLATFDLTWNSNFVEDFIEVCAGEEALSDNDIEVLHPTTGNLVGSAVIPLSWMDPNDGNGFLYGPSPDGPWTQAPGSLKGGSYHEWLVDLSINNVLGYHYFVLRIQDPLTGCIQYSNPAILNVVSSLIVEAGDPNFICGGSSVPLTGSYVGGISSSTITGQWSITSLNPSNGANMGSLSSTTFTTNPSGVSYTPPAGYVGEVTLTLTTNDPSGVCVPITDTRTVTVVPPNSFNGCLQLADWTPGGSNSNGMIDDSEEPCLVTLVGSDNQSGTPGSTDMTHCSGAGTLSFDWSFLAPPNKIVWHQEDQKIGSNNGSSSRLEVAPPSNISIGDLIIVTIHENRSTGNISNSEGFTQIRRDTYLDQVTLASFYKIATAADVGRTAVYRFNLSNASSNDRIYSSRITGHNTSNPIGNSSGVTREVPYPAEGYMNISIPSINVSTANSMLVTALSINIRNNNDDVEFINSPVGSTTMYYENIETTARVARETLLNTGATGTRIFSWPSYNSRNRSNMYTAAQMFAINPAPNEIDAAYYLINGTPTLLGNTNGTSGSISVPVSSGNNIGFRVGTSTNTGGPGKLVIYNLDIPNDTPVLSGLDTVFIAGCHDDTFVPTFTDPTVDDNCDSPTVKTGYPIDGLVTIDGCKRFQERTWVYVDECGAESLPFSQIAAWTVLEPLSVDCPVDPDLAACTDPADITTAYNTWKAGFTVTGGCAISSNINEIPPLILSNIACGNVLTFTFTATDNCGQEESCTSTFTVQPIETLDIFCPVDPVLSSCSDNATITAAYDAWKAGFTYSGGCASVTDNIASIPPLSDITTCGGQLTFIYAASNNCGQSQSCVSTFTIEPVTELTITVPPGVSLPLCSNTADITTAYDNWKAGFTTSGGCQVVTNMASFPALADISCGGTVSFTFTAENGLSSCANQVEGTSSFSVSYAPELTVSCPVDPVIEGCLGIQAITDAYDTWVDGFSTSGGCNVTTNIASIPPLGDMVCNGQITFTYIVENGSGVCADYIECTSTFTIGAAPDLEVTVPPDVTYKGCNTNQDIIDIFNAWKADFGYTGGCDVTTSDISVYSIPSSCGGTVTVEYTATDNCGQSVTKSASFTLNPEDLTVVCPGDEVQAACQSQEDIDAAFDIWKAQFGFSGGCGSVGTDLSAISAPNACGGTVIVNYSASDVCGQVTNCSAIFTIDEPSDVLQEPTFTVPSDMTIYKDDFCNHNADPSITGIPTNLEDNCTLAGNLTMSYSDEFAAGTCTGSVIITRTWTVADNCLNETSKIQTITVLDNIAPVITCAADVSGVADDGICEATGVDLGTTDATDNCLLASLVGVRDDGKLITEPYPVGTTTITWTATDACGNSSDCEQSVTIVDDQPPTITCPAPVVQAALANDCYLDNVAIDDPVYDDNCEVTTLTWTFTDPDGDVHSSPATGINNVSGQTFEVGVTTVTYTVSDAAGNSATCSFDVTIIDNNPPEFTAGCPISTITADAAPGLCEAPVNVPAPTVIDPCGESFTLTHDSPYSSNTDNADGNYPVGTTIVNWTATDASGNVTVCQQTIIVNDVTNPTITCPADIEETAAADDCSKILTSPSNPVIGDDCTITTSLDLTWTFTDPDGDVHSSPATGNNTVTGQTFEVGVTTVTYTVTDIDGNSASCSFTVTIRDINPPVFTNGCPSDIGPVDAEPGKCEAFVDVPEPPVTDPCNEGFTLTNDYTGTDNASAVYPVGETNVVWTIEDASGNITTCTQKITVVDAEDPTITCPASVTEQIDAGDCSKTGATLSGLVYDDNCGVVILTWEIEDPLGNTTSSPATGINLVDGQTFLIGVSTVTYTAYDAAGNSATCTFTVTIERLNIPPSSILCPVDPAPVATSAGNCDAFVAPAAPTDTDPCATATYTWENDFNNTADASDTYPIGITVVTWTITDNSGKTTTCTQNVEVTDNQPPVITTCPATLSFAGCDTDAITGLVFSATEVISSYVDFSDATNQGVATDNCDIVKVTYIDVVTGSCPTVVTRTWTVFDVDDNTDQCNQIITIDDNVAPVVDCPTAGFETPSDFNLPYATFSIPAFDYSDNCTAKNDITITWTLSGDTNDSGTGIIPAPYQFGTGTTTVSYVFTDNCGNFTECEFTITAFSPPDIECIPPVIYNTDLDVCHHNVDPTDVDHPGVPTNSTGETLDWTWTINNPDGSFGMTGGSSGASPTPVGPYDFQLGVSTIHWSVQNASGTDECDQLVTVVDNQPPIFEAIPFEDCVERLMSAVYTGNDDDIQYNPDYPDGDYKILYVGDTYLDIDLNTYWDNCCTLADGYTLRWEIDFEGNDPGEPSISGAGQPSTYVEPITGDPLDIFLWGDGTTFLSRVHSITYWMTDCHNNESLPVTVNITIKPRPELIKITN